MAVTLPSDLVADVMRAADPSRLKTAAARLNGTAQLQAAFSGILDSIGASDRLKDRNDDLIADVLGAADGTKVIEAKTRLSGMSPTASQPEETYKAFEQMVLRNMFESMMPAAESGVYGEDSSAGIWRSIANDQMARVYADWGGLGIAKNLVAADGDPMLRPQGQWPYFETPNIRSFTG
jgi:peptidoglycan hydrolase FlgJ